MVQAKYFLEPGYLLVATRPTLMGTVLGSCVAVCIYDRKRKVGGMNHFQLPSTTEPDKATAYYGNVATLALIRMMFDGGSKTEHLEAQIFGGAYNPKLCSKDTGRNNVEAARKVLAKKQIRVVSEDVGGEKWRKIVFNTHTNEIAVMRVNKIRTQANA